MQSEADRLREAADLLDCAVFGPSMKTKAMRERADEIEAAQDERQSSDD